MRRTLNVYIECRYFGLKAYKLAHSIYVHSKNQLFSLSFVYLGPFLNNLLSSKNCFMKMRQKISEINGRVLFEILSMAWVAYQNGNDRSKPKMLKQQHK